MRAYLKSIVDSHGQNLSDASVPISYDLDIDGLVMPIEQALLIGLIVAELQTNSLKHAFHGRTAGRIAISLKHQADGTNTLRVADDGIGLQTKDIDAANSLGMRLITAMAASLGGVPQIGSASGHEVTINLTRIPETGLIAEESGATPG